MQYLKKAYTMLEALLTLVIASLIIVFMYTAYLYLDKQLFTYQQESSYLLQRMVFEDVMRRDLYGCETVTPIENGVSLRFYDQHTVMYIKRNDSLFRQTEGQREYLELTVRSIQHTTTDHQNRKANRIEVQSVYKKEVIPLSFYKYSPNIVNAEDL